MIEQKKGILKKKKFIKVKLKELKIIILKFNVELIFIIINQRNNKINDFDISSDKNNSFLSNIFYNTKFNIQNNIFELKLYKFIS